ncbi:MAG: hypothetical protein ACR2QM_21005 [Longimicrobiales bacterium]
MAQTSPTRVFARLAARLALLPILIACETTSPTDESEDPSSLGVVLNEDLSDLPVFPSDNWWNRSIEGAPVDPGSDDLIDWICDRPTGATECDTQVHPDFGPPPYGIPYVVVPGSQALSEVDFVLYGDESDAGAPGRASGYPIPDVASTTPNYIEGGVAGGGNDGDRHLLVIDRDNQLLFETWATRWNGTAGRWEAGSGAVFDLGRNDRRTEGWTSADAAGLAVFPGLIRYDELESSEEIEHAFRFTTRATDAYVWPASHQAGTTSGAPPMGARLRLKASVDISGYDAEVQKIFRALKRYGLILADNGADMFVQGTMDPRWDNDVLNPAFHSLQADDFEVIELGWRP